MENYLVKKSVSIHPSHELPSQEETLLGSALPAAHTLWIIVLDLPLRSVRCDPESRCPHMCVSGLRPERSGWNDGCEGLARRDKGPKQRSYIWVSSADLCGEFPQVRERRCGVIHSLQNSRQITCMLRQNTNINIHLPKKQRIPEAPCQNVTSCVAQMSNVDVC